MFRIPAICGLVLAAFTLAGVHGARASDFPEGVDAVHLKIVPDQKFGETLTAKTGDVVYSDTRAPVKRRVVAAGDIRDVCSGVTCHNVPAGTEYVQIPYGISMYCTREKYAEKKSLFSSSEEHACLKLEPSSGTRTVEVFSIGSFRDSIRIDPQEVDMGNYLKLEDTELEELPPSMSEGWGHFFEPVELVYLGASEGRIRFKLSSREEGGASRLISYPYEGGSGRFPVSGVNPNAGDQDYDKVPFRGTDEEVTGMAIQVETADAESITYNLQQVTFVRQFMGSKINLVQGNTTISLTYGPKK